MTNAVSIAQLGANNSSFTNRIINGGMVIDQRNAGASVTPIANAYTLDRWAATMPVTSKYSVQQNAGSVTPPTGFTNYLGATSLSAYSVLSTETYAIQQAIEGVNVADLAWGSANAATVTLSFWVRSSLTGTFGGSIKNSAADRSYPFSYTISSANTWTNVSVTIPGDTTGTWLTNTSAGVYVVFSLASGTSKSTTAGSWAAGNYTSVTGATSVVGTNGATFYITGVQLEKGSTATSFDYRPYGTELALCQRYYWKFGNTSQLWRYANWIDGTSIFSTHFDTPVTMRSAPTVSTGTFTYRASASYTNGTVSSTEGDEGMIRIVMSFPSAPNTAGYGALMLLSDTAWSASAEL